jgi:ribosome-interacting GTPase 1
MKMPVNAPIEYYKAEENYNSAKTREEKIKYLEEMIRLLPHHHGSEKMLAQLKKRLAKLKSQKEIKGARSGFTVRKEGVGQVCLIGLTNSGKSTLLKKLTGIDVEIASHPYTTVKPEIGMMRYEDIWVQLVEIPSTFEPEWMSIAHSCDLVIKVIDGDEDINKQRNEMRRIMDKHKIKVKSIKVITKKPINLEKLKEEIWENLNVIRVYTKPRGGKPEKPLILKKGSTVRDSIKEVHKEFLKHFRFAIVWGKSVKHGESRVGLEHVLKDKDVVEIRA